MPIPMTVEGAEALRDELKNRKGSLRQEIEGKLADAQVIDISKITPSDKVIFGVTVTLVDEDGKSLRYRIVGEDEADLKDGKISVMSPIARAVVGKSVGDVGVVQTPNGLSEYEIDGVDYG
jgi:transcription elongation factor GreA